MTLVTRLRQRAEQAIRDAVEAEATGYDNGDRQAAEDVIKLCGEVERLREALRNLIDWVEIQRRTDTPAPKHESRDDAASRDERDQVFGREIMRAEAALEGEQP